MSKSVTITRKIRLNINEAGEAIKDAYKTLYDWNEKIFRAANLAATHMYFQEKQSEFFYLTDETKLLLSDATIPISKIKSDKMRQLISDGAIRAFNTSKQNTTYRVLSDKFKGEIPSDIFNNLNAQLSQTFNSERKEYFSGKRSLRTYRRDMPMPFSARKIKNIQLTEDGKNYQFTLFGINFKTYFGRDLSGNKVIFDRGLKGEYKLCNSSIKLDGKKILLLAVFQFEPENFFLDKDKVLKAELSIDVPIKITIGGKEKQYHIGNKDEFLYRRMQIQEGLRRAQIASRFNKGGKGRKKKMSAIGRYHLAEKNYVTTRIHQYTAKLIDLCIKSGCGTLNLVNQEEKENEAKEVGNELLLRNWSYFGMKEKIKYKCNKAGIELIES